MPDPYSSTAAASGMTLQMLDALAFLAGHADHGREAPTGHELAAHQGRSDESNAAKTLRKLHDRGLWTRTPFAITSAGRRLLNEAVEMLDEARPVITHGMLTPSPLNPRTTFEELPLIELAQSIRTKGQIQAIVARPTPGRPGHFEIAAGERRWRAINLLILDPSAEDWTEDTPLKVDIRPLSDAGMLAIALAENKDRLDPHPLDEAQGFAKLVDLHVERGAKQSNVFGEIAGRMGKTKRFVEIRVKIARDLIEEGKTAFKAGEINFTQAMELSRAKVQTQHALLAPIRRGDEGYRTQSNIVARIKEIEEARPLPIETPSAREDASPLKQTGSEDTPDPTPQSAASPHPADAAAPANSREDQTGAAANPAPTTTPEPGKQQDAPGKATPAQSVHAYMPAQDLMTVIAFGLNAAHFKIRITLDERAPQSARSDALALVERLALEARHASQSANHFGGDTPPQFPSVAATGRVLAIGL